MTTTLENNETMNLNLTQDESINMAVIKEEPEQPRRNTTKQPRQQMETRASPYIERNTPKKQHDRVKSRRVDVLATPPRVDIEKNIDIFTTPGVATHNMSSPRMTTPTTAATPRLRKNKFKPSKSKNQASKTSRF